MFSQDCYGLMQPFTYRHSATQAGDKNIWNRVDLKQNPNAQRQLKIADYFPSILSLQWQYAITSFLGGMREGWCSIGVVKPTEGTDYAKKSTNGPVELKYIVMDGCMLLNKSSTISENCKERKRHAVLFSGARTLTLNCRKTEDFTNETSDRCLQELNRLCCWQFSTLYTYGYKHFQSIGRLWLPVNRRQLHLARGCSCSSIFTEHVMPFSIIVRAHWGAVLSPRWPSWALRPNEPYGFRGRKAILNHANALVSACS